MKKLSAFLIAIICALSMVGCTATSEPTDVEVMSMTGATSMGLIKFIDDADSIDSNNYNFTIASTIDEVTPMITTGEVDIAAVPANVASVLYNNADGAVTVLTVNTLGVLYIVENGDSITDISDLAGKTIYASGKGGTPEYALNYILEQNGLTDEVTIEWLSEQSEVVTTLATMDDVIAMLPQPFVTAAQMSNDSIEVKLDLTDEWDAVTDEGSLLTGVVVANTEFLEENPEAVADFLSLYEESVNYVNSNVEEAAALIDEYGIVSTAIATIAIPECNIVYVDGEEMKDMLSGYLQVLYDQEPSSIGGAMPGDDFYYVAE